VQQIFVGDVQGCADELDEVVERAGREFGDAFELWLVGDLVNRGPASRRALERVRELERAGRARVVLGNHELALLRVAYGQRAPAPDDTFQELLGRDRDTWLDWIRGWPLALSGQLGARRFAMVHAAVSPEWRLPDLEAKARRVEARLRSSREEASRLLAAEPADDPDADVLARVTRCRSVDARGRWSSRPPARPDDAWHRRWAAHGHDYGVVYGHWALQGLHVAPMLRGLDSGCVYHGFGRDGFLTAWLPRSDAREPFAVPDEHFWRIPARGLYWRGDSSSASVDST
jgi:bis(5'-nucleosyl)-tetraphosphatase (symmetrical)